MIRRGWGFALAVVLGGAAAAGLGYPAAADTVIDNGTPGLLVLHASPYPFEPTLEPGQKAYWQLTAASEASNTGTLSLQPGSLSGLLATDPAGLTLELQECSTEWLAPSGVVAVDGATATCGGTTTTVIATTPLASLSTETLDLGPLLAGQSRYLLATVAFPSDAPDELQGSSATFAFDFAAMGDDEGVLGGGGDLPDPPGLASTGVSVGVPIAAGIVLALIGGALVRRRSRRAQ